MNVIVEINKGSKINTRLYFGIEVSKLVIQLKKSTQNKTIDVYNPLL